MINSQMLLQDMIDIVYGNRKLEETFFSSSAVNLISKGGISKLLRWLFVQDFVGDTEATEYDKSFSSGQVIQLIDASPELQRYFRIKDGVLAFVDSLSGAEALDMIQYVKQNYRPQVNF